jgi:hypothetical protein
MARSPSVGRNYARNRDAALRPVDEEYFLLLDEGSRRLY